MKKVSLKFIVDQLGELGWDYSCGRMSRSGMEIYDGIMRHVGVIKPYEQNRKRKQNVSMNSVIMIFARSILVMIPMTTHLCQ